MPIEPSDGEEKYFRDVDAEARRQLRKQLEANAVAMQTASGIAAVGSTDDLELAEQIRQLGFDGETAKVFDLLPLVHVAWADGTVQKAERKLIMRVVASRGLGPESAGAKLLAALLDERPPEAFIGQSRELLRRLIGRAEGKADDIVQLCIQVAAASGGFLGLGERIGEEERQAIAKISLVLGDEATDKVLEDLE